MRIFRAAQGPRLLAVFVVLILLLGMAPPAVPAQDDDGEVSCPEGLVPDDEVADLCVLPEEEPADEPVEEPVTDDSGDAPVDEGEEPVSDDGEAPDEEPVDETDTADDAEPMEEEDPTGDDAAETIGDLTLQSYACPEGTDPRDGTADRDTGCSSTVSPAFTYTINVDNALVGTYTLQAGGGAPGSVSLSGADTPIPAGTMAITMTPVDGWTTGFVACTVTTADGGQQTLEPSFSGESVSFAVAAGDAVACDWYTVPGDGQTPVDTDNLQGVFAEPPPSTGTRVLFDVRNCPAGTVETDDLSAKCVGSPAAGVTFTVSSETETLTSGTTTADGMVEFVNVPEGTWAFIETLPAGYGEPVVACMGTNVDEALMEVLFGNQIRVSLPIFDGDVDPYLDCTWFNLPAQGADSGPSIFIQTRWCPVDVKVPGNYTLTQAETLCPDVFAGKTFTVSSNGQGIDTASSGQNGQAFFTKLPGAPAPYEIRPTLGNRESSAGVFCDKGPANGPFEVISPTFLGGSGGPGIQAPLAPGETMRCSWFIAAQPKANPIPTVVPGASENWYAIEIYVRECPATIALEAADEFTCAQDMTGVAFEIMWNGEYFGTYVNNGRNGILQFIPELGPGTYVLTPRPIEGYGEPRFSCDFALGPNAGGGSAGVLTAASPGITIEMGESGGAFCMLYYQAGSGQQAVGDQAPEEAAAEEEAADEAPAAEAPDAAAEGDAGADDEEVTAAGEALVADDAAPAGNALTVQFWACPAGTDPAADQIDLLVVCSMDRSDRALTVTIDGVPQQQTVPGSGTWEYTGSAITVDIGAGSTSSAWCSSTWVENGEDGADFPDTVALDGGALTLTVSRPATTSYCDWFLFPD